MMSEALKNARKNLDAAKNEYLKLWQKEFPVGTRISWLYQGRHQQYGIVEFCDNCLDRLRVRNERTGRLVNVYGYDSPYRID